MTMLARAYLEVIPSLKGAASSIRKELEDIVGNPLQPKGGPPVPKSWSQSVQDFGGQWTSTGKEIMGVGKTFTGLTAPITGAAVAAGGLTAALGWKRLVSVDTARSQLKGLGYSTEDVTRISGQLSKALEGGMMTMGDATSAAASGMAAGVSEGKELTKYIQLLDAAVVGGNGSFDEMNQIFAQTADVGHLTARNFDMMQMRMPGFSSAMQEHMGVSSEALREMLNNGEVTTDDFLEMMDDFAGDMAQEYAKSWEGMAKNTLNYVGMIGEGLLEGVFQISKEELGDFISMLSSDEVQARAREIGETIRDVFQQVVDVIRGVVDWWTNLSGSTQKVVLAIAGIVAVVGPLLMIVAQIVITIGGLITAVGTIIGWVSKLSIILTGASKVIGLVTGAVRALSLAMMANPAALIITAIVALVAALIWFFTQTELGQQIVEQVVAGAIIAWEWLRDTSIAVFDAVVGAVVGAWEWIRDKTVEIWDAVVGWVTDNWSTIVDFLALLNPVTAVIRHWDKIKVMTALAWQWVKDKISTVWNGTIQLVANAGARVVAAVTGAWNKAKSFTSNTWQAILSLISNAWNRIKSTVFNMAASVISAILNAWNRAKSTTTNAWNGIKTAVSNGIIGVVNYVRGLPGRVLSALGNIGSLLLGSGRALVDGFTQGIKNAFGKAVDAVKNGVQRVRNFFPFSPAKEGPLSGHGYTSYSGRALVSDFAEGMAAAEADVVRQAESITRAAAFDAPSMPAATLSAVPASAQESGARGGVTNEFHITNPVAEPTSETARKASAYIGVSV